jgi:glutamyl-tRNA synthetase
MTIKVRFAPSPTGKLHVGNVRAALHNWLFASKHKGVFVLRIDDTDLARSTVENEDQIEADLEWLGLDWGEKYNQSKRFELYDQCADYLKKSGRLYACYDTQDELDRRRKVQLSRGLPPVYDRAGLALSQEDRLGLESEGRRPHWRFKLEGKRVAWNDHVRGHCEVDTSSMSDPVLIREDGAYLYTLPSVVDDLDMKITHVIRGEDHVANTGTQLEIFEALSGFFKISALPEFAHMSLLVGGDGEALSKRLGSMSLMQMRDEGIEPDAIVAHLARLGTSDPLEAIADRDVLIEGQDFAKLGRAPARYDFQDLLRINASLLHNLSFEKAKPRLSAIGIEQGEDFWVCVRANLTYFHDVNEWNDIVSAKAEVRPLDRSLKEAAIASLPNEFDDTSWKQWTSAISDRTGLKGKSLFMPLRLCLTGKEKGPDMAALILLIGRDLVQKRLSGT